MPVLDQWIEKLVEKQPLIIVEGIKDKKALSKLGIKNVITLQGKPMFEVVELVMKMTDTCIILTDLDPEGKKIYTELKKQLQRFSVKVDDRFRNFLFKKTALRQIEGLARYVSRPQKS